MNADDLTHRTPADAVATFGTGGAMQGGTVLDETAALDMAAALRACVHRARGDHTDRNRRTLERLGFATGPEHELRYHNDPVFHALAFVLGDVLDEATERGITLGGRRRPVGDAAELAAELWSVIDDMDAHPYRGPDDAPRDPRAPIGAAADYLGSITPPAPDRSIVSAEVRQNVDGAGVVARVRVEDEPDGDGYVLWSTEIGQDPATPLMHRGVTHYGHRTEAIAAMLDRAGLVPFPADTFASPRVSRASLVAAVDTWDGDAMVTKAHAADLVDHLDASLNPVDDEREWIGWWTDEGVVHEADAGETPDDLPPGARNLYAGPVND